MQIVVILYYLGKKSVHIHYRNNYCKPNYMIHAGNNATFF